MFYHQIFTVTIYFIIFVLIVTLHIMFRIKILGTYIQTDFYNWILIRPRTMALSNAFLCFEKIKCKNRK